MGKECKYCQAPCLLPYPVRLSVCPRKMKVQRKQVERETLERFLTLTLFKQYKHEQDTVTNMNCMLFGWLFRSYSSTLLS